MRIANDPCWWVHRAASGGYLAVDDRAQVEYRIGDAIGAALCRSHELLAMPLVNAIEHVRAAGEPDRAPSVDLVFCGSRTRYVCPESAVIRRLREDYPALVATTPASPDAVVCLDANFDVTRAHRAHITQSTRGAALVDAATGDLVPIPSELPVVPHMWHSALASRLFALHAALLVTPTGKAVAVCGEQSAGKTTAALIWVESGLGELLTDELVVVDSVTTTVAAVPLPVSVRNSPDRTKTRSPIVPASRPTARFRSLDAIVILQHPGAPTTTEARQTLGLLAHHTRPLRVCASTVHRCLARLIESSVWVALLRVGPWPELRSQLAEELTRLAKEELG